MVIKSSGQTIDPCESGDDDASTEYRLTDRYRRAWAAVLSLGVIWNASTILQVIQYKLSNRAKERAWAKLTPEEQAAYKEEYSNEPISKRLDARYAL